MDEKKKYRVTDPVAWGGRRERGEILLLTEKEASDIGLVEPVIEANTEPAADTSADSGEASTDEATSTAADTSADDAGASN